jgi:hypothetical protein
MEALGMYQIMKIYLKMFQIHYFFLTKKKLKTGKNLLVMEREQNGHLQYGLKLEKISLVTYTVING